MIASKKYIFVLSAAWKQPMQYTILIQNHICAGIVLMIDMSMTEFREIQDAAILEVHDKYELGMRKVYVRTSWLSDHWVDGIQELDDGQRLVITPSILRTLQKIYVI